MHVFESVCMARLSSFLLAQADGDHFDQAAFVGAAESGMRFDPVDNDDTVRLVGVLIDIHRHSVR